MKMETTSRLSHKSIKWLVLDFGNNNFVKNINFSNWVIRLKDNKEYFMVNFNVYDNLDYKTCYNDYISYITTKLNVFYNLNEETDNKHLITTDGLTSYLRNKIIDLIYEDLIQHLDNNIDILKLNVEKEKLLAIPVFENNSTLYVCIINFSNVLSRILQLTINNTSLFDNTIYHLINVKSGINHFKEVKKINGFSFNFMTSLWNRIESNNSLLMKEYKIGKFKFNLGNLIYSLNNKFPRFYVIFESPKAKLDKTKQTFLTHFYPIKDKTKRAKKLNKLKNLENILVKDILDNLDVDLNINFNNLSLTDKEKKKFNKKCIQLPINHNSNFNNISRLDNITNIQNLFENHNIANTHSSLNNKEEVIEEVNKKELHTICKNLTGSKHCYYSGYNDIIKSFDKFTLSMKTEYSLIDNNDNDYNEVDMDYNDDE